jgi:hypothetical protein
LAIGLVFAARPAFGQLASDNPAGTALHKAVDKAVGEFFQQDQHVGLSIGIYDHGKAVFYNYGTVSKSKVRMPDRKQGCTRQKDDARR